jgi:hypothetical protein
MSNDKRDMARAYGIALSRLRKAHDPEFQAILTEVYSDLGMHVKKRMSRMQAHEKRIAEAKKLIESSDI